MAEPVRAHDLPEDGVEDMITLDNLSEDTMLQNLHKRYEKNKIYTYTGTILISVNPFKSLPIYTSSVLNKYIGKRIGLEPPHIFAVADEAYRNLRERSQNQSIIISGESGSGKTEATKLILQYLATMTNKHSEVEQAILQSSPVLEAFGNAKTVRNNNSSRFGKLIEVNFSPEGAISGARITQYLLEKSRIVTQAATERNYHIFYQMCAGASDEEKAAWKVGKAEDYRYLNQSGCTSIAGVDDDELFQKTRTAMRFLGVTSQLQDTLFAILSAVLHIGNIEFADVNEKAKIKNEDTVLLVASLLQVDEKKLMFALTNRTLKISGTETVVPLKLDQAVDTRDALAKALYSKLFEWLVTHINKVIMKPNAKLFIGVLDIFGFENFKVNSFEQLCINFTNEKLQLHFNEHIFRLEQEEYAREKIVWTKVDFKDNQECIDLIERSQAPLGVLALLDEECRFPKASDTTFLEKISQTHIKHKYFDRPKTSKSSFVVKHYAGNVSYEVKDFLEKNRDTLQVDLLNCLMTSKVELVKTLMRAAAEAAATPEDKSQAGKRAPTVGGNFKNQLLALMKTLSETHAHYVRCIKPNALQAADNFDVDLVLAQLRYAGMLETVRIRRCGYPIRFQFTEFYKRYALMATGKDAFKPGKEPRANCERLLERLKLDREHVQAGQTKMFLRDYQYAAMEDKRNALLTKFAIRIQTWYRARIARRWYLEQKRAAIVMQKYIRRYLALNRFVMMYIASVALQKAVRALTVRKEYKVKLVEWREKKRKEEEERKRLEELRKKEEAEKKRQEEERKKREEEERKRLEEQRKKEEAEKKRKEEEERKRQEELRKKEEEERKKREEEERARMTAEQLRLAEEKRKKEEAALKAMEEERRLLEETRRKAEEERKALEEARRKMEEEQRAAAEALKRQMEERLEEERKKREEEDKRRKEEEEKKRKEEEERKRREEEEAKKGGRGRGLTAGTHRSGSGTGASLPAPVNRTEDSNPLVTHVASMAIQKQLLEAQRVNEKKWKPFQLANGIAEPQPLLADSLANEFTFFAYAQKNFRPPDDGKASGWFGFGKKKPLTIAELCQFSKVPLETSLLALAPHFSVSAVDTYNNVFLRHALGEPVPHAALQEALRKGVLKPELRDELYCQVLRLCSAAPAECIAHSWELVALVCGAFLPSSELLKHVAGHLIGQRKNANKDVAQWAAYSLRRLERSALQASRGKKLYRVQAPSVAEINAIRGRGPIGVAVFTLDEERYEIEVDSATTANECLGLLSEKVGLSDASFWAVYEIFSPLPAPAPAPGQPVTPTPKLERLERSLYIEEYVCDALAKAEFAKSYTFQLVFKRKIFLFPQLLPDDPRELELLYYQTADDLLEGRLPVSEKEALRLAAYRMKYEEHFVKIENLIPRPLWKKRSEAEWKKMLIKEEVQVTNKAEAMHFFLSNASYLTFFGASLFPVENTTEKSLPREFDLMVNVEGVHFVRGNDGTPEARKILASYFYADVKIDYTAASVTVVYAEKNGKPKSLELNSKRGSEVHSIYRDYVYWLQAQSEWAKATQDYLVDDASLLSFRVGDVIKVTDKSNPEWYQGERNGMSGVFPSSSVILLLRPPPEAGPEGRGRKRAPTAKVEPNAGTDLRSSGGGGLTSSSSDVEGGVRRRTGTVARDRSSTAGPSDDAQGGRERAGSMGGRARSGSSASQSSGRSRAMSRLEPLPPKFIKHDSAKWATHQADVGNHTRLEVFAQAYLKGAAAISGAQRGRVNIGRRSETMDASHFVPLVSFTKEPIKDCMLPIDSALVKTAVENFRCVMRLMDDLPRGQKQDWEEMQSLMASGLEHGASNPELNQMTLVEEIFLQIMRQINNNPRIESQRRGFELLCVACGTLVPNNLVFKVLVGFLTETSAGPLSQDEVIGDLIKDCLDRLVYLREGEAERHLPPSTQEIQAVQVGGQLQQIVYFSDGKSKTLDVECVTTVKDFVDQLGEPRRFRGYAMFEVLMAAGLYMENPLKPEELIVDVLSRWERFVPPVKVEGELVFQLIWKKHIFLKSDPDETHPTALNLLYHQMVSSVVTNQIPTTEEEAIYLAGVQLRHDFDTQDEAHDILETHLDSYLPSMYHRLPVGRPTLGVDGNPVVGRGSPQLPRILHVYNATPVLPKSDLQRLYLSRVKQLPLYGCSTFNVQYPVERRMRPCLLALSEDHLQLWEVGPNQKAPVKRLEYADIASWGPKQGTLNITSGDLFNPSVDIIETTESFEIAEVIRAYKTAKAEAQLYAQRGELHY